MNASFSLVKNCVFHSISITQQEYYTYTRLCVCFLLEGMYTAELVDTSLHSSPFTCKRLLPVKRLSKNWFTNCCLIILCDARMYFAVLEENKKTTFDLRVPKSC